MSHRSTRLTRWVTDDQGRPRPVPTYEHMYSVEDVKQMQMASASNKYKLMRDHEGNLAPGEQDYDGMACLEVALDRRAQAAAQGDLMALNQLEDRIVGKPKQEVQNTNISLSFSEIAAERIAAGALGYRTVRDELIEQGIVVEVVQQEKQYEDLGF